MHGMMQCICCNFFLVCHRHNSLPLGPIQPSSPSTKELHAQVPFKLNTWVALVDNQKWFHANWRRKFGMNLLEFHIISQTIITVKLLVYRCLILHLNYMAPTNVGLPWNPDLTEMWDCPENGIRNRLTVIYNIKSISEFFSEIPTEFANQTKIGIREIRVLRNNKCNRFSMNLALV